MAKKKTTRTTTPSSAATGKQRMAPARKKSATRANAAAPKAKKESKPKRTSGLDAAAQILAASKEPMNAQAIVKEMLEKKLWSTNGATPHATIYAAMIREIQQKGSESRFKKVERGRFTLTPAAKKGS